MALYVCFFEKEVSCAALPQCTQQNCYEMFTVTTRCRVCARSKRKWTHNARLLSTKLMTHLASLYLTLPSLLFKNRKKPCDACYEIMVFFGLKFKKFQQFNSIETIETKRGKDWEWEIEHPQFNLFSAFFLHFKRKTFLTFTPRFPSVSCVELNSSQ